MKCTIEEANNCRIYKANFDLMESTIVLLENLEKYGQHKSNCSYEETACDCGLDDTIYSYAAKLPFLRIKFN
jgi:hypothetical protein